MASCSHTNIQPDSGESAENDSFSSFLTAFILALLPGIYFTPMLLSGLSLLPGDGVMKLLGERILLGKMIAAGQLPLWNPYTLAGAPLLANEYVAAFYPPNWIFALFSPVTAMNIMVITTYHLALIGSYLYGRRIGMSRLGGIISGIAFTFSGFMIAEMGIGPRLAAAAWLPWVLLAIENLRQKGSWRWVTLGAIFLALQFFAGDPQTSFFTVLICLLIVVGSYKPKCGEFIRNVVAMFVFGFLLSMVQIVPLRELMQLAARKTLVGEASHPAQFYIYLILLTLILTVVALYGRRGNKQVSFWTIAGLLSLYLALSNKRQLFYYLPHNDFLSTPANYLYLFSFSIAVLTGIGASYLAKVERKTIISILKSISPAFLAIALLVLLGGHIYTGISYTDGLLALAFTAISLPAVRFYAQRRNALGSLLLILVFLADLMTFGLALNAGRCESITGIKERLQDPPGVQFIKSRESDPNAFRVISYSADAQRVNFDLLNLPNLSLARGLQSLNGIEEQRTHWHAEINGDAALDGSGITPNLFAPGNQWLNLLNVKYFLLEENSFNDEKPGSEKGESLGFIRTHWRRVGRYDDVSIYENAKFLPRAWFVKRLAVAKESEISQIISSGSMMDGSPFDPYDIALLPGEYYQQSDAKFSGIGDPPDARVDVLHYEPNRIDLNTRNDRPGFLVLSELYYRGWGARIDGKKAPVELVNNALRGIAVPAGEHRIEFRYLQSMYNGASYLLSGILVLLGGNLLSLIGTERLRQFVPINFSALVEKPRSALRILTEKNNLRLSLRSTLFFIRSKSLIIAAVLGLGIYGYLTISSAQYAVGGSDSFGYLSLAHFILQGKIVRPVKEPARLDLPANYSAYFIPLAYVAGKDPGTMEPVYPPGLPLHFIAGALILGWEIGPFVIAPLMAMASLILIYLIGLELSLSRKLSFVGALILAVNPTSMASAMQAMSDGPSTCWALAAIYASLRSKKAASWTILSGFSFGVAFLIRPTNILLLLPIFFSLRLTRKTLLNFVLGGAPVAAVFFIFNSVAYGHPLMTGYVATNHQQLLRLNIFPEYFRAYSYSVASLMSPLLLLGWLCIVIDREISWRTRSLLLIWFATFFLFYCFYLPYDEPWHARFLLPGIPALILGSLLTYRYLTNLLKKYWEDSHPFVNRVFSTSLFIIVISAGVNNILFLEIFDIGPGRMINKESCLWADRIVPHNALIAAKEMSGVLTLYSQRQILRYDYMGPGQWELLKKRAAEKGYSFYALLMTPEISLAKEQLPGKWKHIGTYKVHISLWQIQP